MDDKFVGIRIHSHCSFQYYWHCSVSSIGCESAALACGVSFDNCADRPNGHPLGREYPRNRTGHRISEVASNRYSLGAVGDAAVITMLGLGSYVLHSIANMFIFDLTNSPALRPSDAARARRSATGRVRCPLADASFALGSRNWGRCSPSLGAF
jgi:hypothetical protein